MWYVYILKCADKTLYTGITKDLARRLKEHNSSNLGAKYTRGRRPVKLVYSLKCQSQSKALKKEFSLKKLKRLQKTAVILSGTKNQ